MSNNHNCSDEPIRNAAYYLDLIDKDPALLSDVPQKYRSAKLCKLAIMKTGYKSPAEAVKDNPDLFNLLHRSMIDHDVLLEFIRSSHFRWAIKCNRIQYIMSSPDYRVFYFDSIALMPEDE